MGDTSTACGAIPEQTSPPDAHPGRPARPPPCSAGPPTLALVAHELANAETENDAVPSLVAQVSTAEAGTSWSPIDAVASCLVEHFMGFQDNAAGTGGVRPPWPPSWPPTFTAWSRRRPPPAERVPPGLRTVQPGGALAGIGRSRTGIERRGGNGGGGRDHRVQVVIEGGDERRPAAASVARSIASRAARPSGVRACPASSQPRWPQGRRGPVQRAPSGTRGWRSLRRGSPASAGSARSHLPRRRGRRPGTRPGGRPRGAPGPARRPATAGRGDRPAPATTGVR